MPINFKDYTPIPWSRGGPIDLSKAAPTPPPEKTVPPMHPHHHRLKKLFHLSHKLHLKFL